MLDRIEETAAFLKSRLGEVPKLAMITGTGLEAVTKRVDVQWRIPFHEIPNFPGLNRPGPPWDPSRGALGRERD